MDLRGNQILLGELLDNATSYAVLQKRFGRFLKHPMLKAARSMTLQQVMGFAEAYIPRGVLNETLEDLRKL